MVKIVFGGCFVICLFCIVEIVFMIVFFGFFGIWKVEGFWKIEYDKDFLSWWYDSGFFYDNLFFIYEVFIIWLLF